MREMINGSLYINGYATDGYGRPITVKNGYSSEDEKDAMEAYEYAVSQRGKSNTKETPSNTMKYSKKSKLKLEQPQASRPEQVLVNGELWDVEYYNGRAFIGGYAANESFQPICYETGYTDEDVADSIEAYKQASKGYFFE